MEVAMAAQKKSSSRKTSKRIKGRRVDNASA